MYVFYIPPPTYLSKWTPWQPCDAFIIKMRNNSAHISLINSTFRKDRYAALPFLAHTPCFRLKSGFFFWINIDISDKDQLIHMLSFKGDTWKIYLTNQTITPSLQQKSTIKNRKGIFSSLPADGADDWCDPFSSTLLLWWPCYWSGKVQRHQTWFLSAHADRRSSELWRDGHGIWQRLFGFGTADCTFKQKNLKKCQRGAFSSDRRSDLNQPHTQPKTS